MSLRSIFAAGALVTLGMIAGRVLGLFREMLLAAHFGGTHEADVAIILLIIAEFISNSLITNAAMGTLVPAFFARERSEAIALFWQAMLASVLLFLAIALCIFIGQDRLFALLNQAGPLPAFSTALIFTLASLPLTAATAIITAYLQYCARLTVPAFANAIFNGVIIAALWLPGGLVVLAGGIFAATIIRLAAHVWALMRTDARLPRSWLHPWHLKKTLLKSCGATTATGILTLLAFYALYGIILVSGESVALFNYAFKLVLLPAMLAQMVFQLVLLPWFLRQRGDGQGADAVRQSYHLTLQVSWTLSFAMALSLTLASQALATLCFGYGKMTPANIAQVAHLFSVGVWAVPGMVLTTAWQQILYANLHTRAPLIGNLLQAVLVIPACLFAREYLGETGVLAAYAALQLLPVAIMARQAHKEQLMRHYLPSPVYAYMSLAIAAVFIPAAWAFGLWQPAPVAALLAAMVIGLLSFIAGLAACRPIRIWGLAWIR